jgi:hypothetical protein
LPYQDQASFEKADTWNLKKITVITDRNPPRAAPAVRFLRLKYISNQAILSELEEFDGEDVIALRAPRAC